MSCIHRDFGNTFANIGAREPQLTASKAFTQFGDAHRRIYQYATALLNTIKPVRKKTYFQIYNYEDLFQMISDLNTFLTKAIPDTRLTIEKYADAKFEYLVR